MKTLVVIGAGGHGKVVAEAAAASGQWARIVLLDERYPELRVAAGFDVVGVMSGVYSFDKTSTDALVAVGNNARRLEIVAQLRRDGWTVPVLVHPAAYVSPSATLESGTVVFAQAAVNADARAGIACIINTGATIDHDCRLGDGVHVSPGVHLGGGVMVGNLSWIGIGAAVKHQVKLGERVTVGAGAAVVNDINDGQTVVGVPAR